MGVTNSTPKSFNYENFSNEKNPLVSNLERRRKRKLGFIEDLESGKIYKKMKDTPVNVPTHLNKCLEWHKTKPWLGKPVKFTLIAYPNVGENPPDDIKIFFTSIPFTGTTQKEGKEIRDNGGGYKWFLPSKFLWSAHCFVQHQKDSHIMCESQNLIRTFTDEGGNSQSFIFAVIFSDESFKILDREDYEKECKWWNQHTVATGGYGEKKMFLKSKSVYSSEGETARKIMKKKIAAIFSAINTPIDYKDPFVEEMDREFINATKSFGKTTIFDYVSHCLAILIFIKPESPLYKYTTAFRKRLLAGYYKNSAIPYLETFDMFPEFYASSKSSKDIDRVKQWIKTYHDQEIDDFFNSLISSLDPTASRITNPRDEVFDLSDDLKPNSMSNICPDVDEDSLEDIVIYKDSHDKVFCFNIEQLLDRDENDKSNPLDPQGENISDEFLYKFKKNFKHPREGKKKLKTKEKEEKCTQCKIPEITLHVGNVIKTGDVLESKSQGFCSVECLEKYKNMEELFGPEDEKEREEEERERLREEKEKFEEEKRNIEEKYQIQLQYLNRKFSELQDKLSTAESTIRIMRSGVFKAEGEKKILQDMIDEKQKSLDEQKRTLQSLQNEISEKTGRRDLSKLSVSDIISLIDKKDPIKDKRADQYDSLSKQIFIDQQEIRKAQREIQELNDKILRNNDSISHYEKLINESKAIENDLKEQIRIKDAEHREEFIKKSNEMNIAVAERDSIIKSLTNDLHKLQEDEKIEDEHDKQDRIASINAMKKEIELARKEADDKRKQLEAKNEELSMERKRIQDLANKDADAKKQFDIILSVKQNEIERLSNEKMELNKKLEGVPALQRQIESYRASGNEDKLKESMAKLALLQGNIDQNEILQNNIDVLKRQLIQAQSDIQLCKGSSEKERDQKRIEDLTRQIADQTVLIEQKSSMIDTLISQQEKCNFNDNLTEKMEKLKEDHKEELSKKDSELQRRLENQRDEILREMDSKYKALSPSMSEKEINEKINKLVQIERKKIENIFKEEIDDKKNKLDAEMKRANDLEEKLKSINPDNKKEIEKLESIRDKCFKKITEKIETISMLEREKEECSKKCDERKVEIVSPAFVPSPSIIGDMKEGDGEDFENLWDKLEDEDVRAGEREFGKEEKEQKIKRKTKGESEDFENLWGKLEDGDEIPGLDEYVRAGEREFEKEQKIKRKKKGERKEGEREEGEKEMAREEREKEMAREEREKEMAREEKEKEMASEEREKEMAREEREKEMAREEREKEMNVPALRLYEKEKKERAREKEIEKEENLSDEEDEDDKNMEEALKNIELQTKNLAKMVNR